MRILKRIETNCQATNTPIIPTLLAFIRDYFQSVPTIARVTTIPHHKFCPKKGDVDQFFALAFYSKDLDELEPWMNKDMDRMYETIESRYGLFFREGITPDYTPMRLFLDPLDPVYQPFIIYGFFSLIKIMSGLLLRAAGFYACKTTSGLNYL